MKKTINYKHWIVYPNQFRASAKPYWKGFDISLKFVTIKDRVSFQKKLHQILDQLERIWWMDEKRLCEFVKLANAMRTTYIGVEK